MCVCVGGGDLFFKKYSFMEGEASFRENVIAKAFFSI